MNSMELIHDLFSSALHSADELVRCTDYTVGCRCRRCYFHDPLGRYVIKGPNTYPGAGTDFANFFCTKIGSYQGPNDLKASTELRDSVLVYKTNGIQCLYRDLEHAFLNFEWSDVEALSRVFAALARQLFADRPSRLEVPASESPCMGFVFHRRYQDGVIADPDQDVVRQAAVSGNIGFLEELLKFGATMFKPRNTKEEMWRVLTVISHLWNPHDFARSSQHLMRSLGAQFEPPARRRLFVVMLVLEAVSKMRKQPGHAHYYQECLRLVFESIPEPEVKSCEVRNCLTKLLPPQDQNLIEEVTKQYEFLFPESTGMVTPRSLKHLSRVQIRQSLKEHGCFIKAMLHLDLPSSVKRYVNLGLFCTKNPTMLVRKESYPFFWADEIPMIDPDFQIDHHAIGLELR